MHSERLLPVAGSVNLRELGGYPTQDGQTVRWQKILRAGDLSHLTGYGRFQLAHYGLQYDIDLRSPRERSYAPDNVPEQIIVRSYPVYPTDDQEDDGDLPLAELQAQSKSALETDPYQLMVFNSHSQLAFRCLFKDLLANDQAKHSLLFHCAAGKDRTGIASFLILSALGVDYQIIRQDYLLTNIVYSAGDRDQLRKKLKNKNAAEFINRMNASFSVLGEELDQVQTAIVEKYGTVNQYLKTTMQLSEGDLDLLRKIYLE
ncbi:tyrosine-protein phosphatase [Liquorilactobacillus sicerae]|uniref:tyrosine-protein phosphatase n=1 Tax=Liquorilactobacillus sicerae TaxID=1416943 RepID=UPI00247FE90D|nr:tyrosine-protein phosphatase [Liquorilactobacillus sicerae]